MTLPHSKDKILIADDDTASLTILSNALKQEYALMLATNGFEAFELAVGDKRPDLILLDIVMPGMDGYEVCRRLKEDKTSRNIPVIFITGKTEPLSETRGFEMGAVDYITKPYNLEVVAARIRTHLHLRKMQIFIETLANKRTRELEMQLCQAQKMEAIGYLSAGIVHDFNNILTCILGFAELALNSADEGRDVKDELKEIKKAANRAADLTRQILTSCRKTDFQKMPVPLIPLIKETVKLVRVSLPPFIRIEQTILVSQCIIKADPTQMNQVIMNLCTNAVHAMKEKGGILEIGLDEYHIRKPSDSPCHGVKPGQYYRLVVQDTGHGIPKEIQDKIFDPMFTTKKQGEGTGLGLSMVNEIVKDLKGHILVSSEPDKGTRFEIFLPGIDSKIEKVAV